MIVYYKLRELLKERGMTWRDLCNAGISINTPQKFSQNRGVSTETIDKVCTYLKVQPSEIMEWVDTDNEQAQIKAEIESLQRQLKKLQKGK